MPLRLYGCCLTTNIQLPWIPVEDATQNPEGELQIIGEATPDHFLFSEWKTADAPNLRALFIDQYFRQCDSGPAWMLRFRSPTSAAWTAFWYSADGRTLWIGWNEPHTLSDVAYLLVNSPSTVLMSLQGHLCLHASVVGVDGRAVLLLGSQGAGKSTTAATFLHRGHTVLADDVGILRRRASGYTAASGMTALSLTSATAALFADCPLIPQWSRPGPWEEKWLLPLREPQPAELPVAAVVVLQPRRPNSTEHVVRRLDPLAAQVQLAPHVQAQWLGTEVRRRNFQHLAEPVRHTPVYAAQAADDFAQLPAFVDALAELVGKRAALPTISIQP